MNETSLMGGNPGFELEAAVVVHSGDFEGSDAYRVWACDNQVYGPIPLSVLQEWVNDRRVNSETWIYLESHRGWHQAGTIEALKGNFPKGDDTIFLERECLERNGVDPDELRLFPVLSSLSRHDLAHFIKLAEVVVVQPGEFLIRRREPGDSIYFVLSGTLRARIMVGSDERILSRMTAGQFLGEISMFTQTPRTADVLAEEETRLLRFSSEAFRSLIIENPAAAAPMLYAITATMAQRIMDTNIKLQTEVSSGFVWR